MPSKLVFIVGIAALPACGDGCAKSSNGGAAVTDASASLSPMDAATQIVIADTGAPAVAPSGCAAIDPFITLFGAPPADHAATALYRFAPATGQVTRVAAVTCYPRSLAVDRHGILWASDDDGRLWTIDTTTGACRVTTFGKRQHGFDTLHLAFVSDPAAASTEVLYASDEHDAHGDPAPSRGLARIDRDSLRLLPIGTYEAKSPFRNAPCMIAGTGDGRLFAQCAEQALWLVDLHAAPKPIPLVTVAQHTDWLPHSMRPFVFHGGSLWLFAHPCDAGDCEGGSHVTRFDPATEVVHEDAAILPLIVNAATTSTCAPL